MEQEFWHQRWDSGRIGFHQDRPSPLLAKYWPVLSLPAGSRVFVPLCGKSLDMLWLAEQGHAVLGVELSESAIRQFFAERQLEPAMHASAFGTHFVAGPYELICGDAFALPTSVLADCAGVYDRAALIALPSPMRATYVDTAWHRLRPGCAGLLITLEYPQAQKDGPPFSVEEPEVRERFAADWNLDLLERRDILDHEPGFVAEGVTALATCAWQLARRA